uniref:Nudix hydrolase domain-containing protein n=1 Tax=Picocystis salinarum TaxID=88271 RepID=A0A7S3XCD0_9CHLO|mmetsp:Transcript_11211/g.69247  ORF Transcript_11211/g.69247 Transcript_11211/m.69247 type:complete len:182 (+) Transcript_11211:161-706(+)
MDRSNDAQPSNMQGRPEEERNECIMDPVPQCEEWVDWVDENNQVVGQVTRKRALQEGLHHRAVYVWLCKENGEMLLQKRATSKRIGGGQWDVSVAEHLLPGETYRDAARRGLMEELNVSDADLTNVPCLEPHYRRLFFPEAKAVESEFVASFVVNKWSLEELQVDPLEVAEVRWWQPEEVR